jgi:class 3 adenylate cyclase
MSVPSPQTLHVPLTYPLRRRFLWVVLPTLILFMLSLTALAAFGGRKLLTDFYLERASREADSILSTAKRLLPDEFAALVLARQTPGPALAKAIDAVGAIVDAAVADRQLTKLKLYDEDGIIRYSTVRAEIGRVERGAPLNQTLASRGNVAFALEGQNGPLYELYVYVPATGQMPALVVELYESAEWLNGALRTVILPATVAPLIILIAAILFLTHIVFRSQRELDTQAVEAAQLHDRIGRLISGQAASAARQLDGEGMKGKTVDVTLYYADVRDFTSFAEANPPETVVAMLNAFITLQVDAIRASGGDVDKIIGDAVLAVFYGPDRASRAIACARDTLGRCKSESGLPRGLGIGVHDGFVVAGVIGAPSRQDYTVIGDAVNVAARLCSLAAAGELVVDTRTLARAGHPDGFGEATEVVIKGRTEPVRLRRWIG